jgi:type II secretion system protein N
MFLKNRIVRIISYISLYLSLTASFVIWRFPIDEMKGQIEQLIQTSTPLRVSFGSLKMLHSIGIAADTIKVTKVGQDKDVELIEIKKGLLRPSFFSFLLGEPTVKFDFEVLGGTLDGEVSQVDGKNFLFMNAHGLKLNWLKFLDEEYGVQVSGSLDNQTKILFDNKDFSKTTGEITLKMSNVKAVKFPFASFLAGNDQPIQLGNINGKLNMEKTNINFKEFSIDGSDLQGSLLGSVKMKPNMLMSTLSLDANIKLKGNIEKKVGTILQGIKPKNSDGFHTWKIRGTLGSPIPQ